MWNHIKRTVSKVSMEEKKSKPTEPNQTSTSYSGRKRPSPSDRAPLEDISNKRGMVRIGKSTKIGGSASNAGPSKGTRSQTAKTQSTSNAISTTTSSNSNNSMINQNQTQQYGVQSISERVAKRENLDMMDVDQNLFEERSPACRIPSDVRDIDVDFDEPLCVTTYAAEIFESLKENELKYRPCDYMTLQHDITPGMRSILIDWLIEVAEEYKLASETLYLCTNYIDRYLSKKLVLRGHLQLLGIVCMLIASKFEEVYAPAVDEFVYISDNTYSKDEMFEMEELVLNVLKFSLSAPTVKTFLRRYLKSVGASSEVTSLANYVCELTLQEYSFNQYLPSLTATAATSLALHSFGQTSWSTNLEYYSGYKQTDESLKQCTREMHAMYYASPQSNLQALREKYSHSKFLKASTFQPPAAPPPFVI